MIRMKRHVAILLHIATYTYDTKPILEKPMRDPPFVPDFRHKKPQKCGWNRPPCKKLGLNTWSDSIGEIRVDFAADCSFGGLLHSSSVCCAPLIFQGHLDKALLDSSMNRKNRNNYSEVRFRRISESAEIRASARGL